MFRGGGSGKEGWKFFRMLRGGKGKGERGKGKGGILECFGEAVRGKERWNFFRMLLGCF
jgi:hypothetical protein